MASSSVRHAWEDVDVEPRHAWEAADSDSDGPAWGDESSEDESPEQATPRKAADMLVAMLCELYFEGKLNAMQFCVILFWCGQAGLPGTCKDLGKPPGGRSGHYQRHLDAKLGFTADSKNNYI
eukprot:8997235-Alexandrium_andersonii.AAC.1